MNVQNLNLFNLLNQAELELIFYMLNVVYPSSVEVTSQNITFYRLESIKYKLNKLRPDIKDEYADMYNSIYEKLELDKIQAKKFE